MDSSKKRIGATLAMAAAASLSGCWVPPNPVWVYAHTPRAVTYVPIANCPGADQFLYPYSRVISNHCKAVTPRCTPAGCPKGTFIRTDINCTPVGYVDP